MTTRRLRAVGNALKTIFPGEPQGNVARHLNTLAAMVSRIVGSESSNLPAIAKKIPGAKPESRVKRFVGWLRNDAIESETL